MKQKWFAYIVIAIVILGIVYSIKENPWLVVMPIVVIGGIFLLYKYPPAFLQKLAKPPASKSSQRGGYSSSNKQKTKRDRPRSKTVPFKVIEGGKDDNDTPRYH